MHRLRGCDAVLCCAKFPCTRVSHAACRRGSSRARRGVQCARSCAMRRAAASAAVACLPSPARSPGPSLAVRGCELRFRPPAGLPAQQDAHRQAGRPRAGVTVAAATRRGADHTCPGTPATTAACHCGACARAAAACARRDRACAGRVWRGWAACGDAAAAATAGGCCQGIHRPAACASCACAGSGAAYKRQRCACGSRASGPCCVGRWPAKAQPGAPGRLAGGPRRLRCHECTVVRRRWLADCPRVVRSLCYCLGFCQVG